jgi:hypothetical protein
MQPTMTPELERVHREHFGGVHQLLLLMDSLEQEETFYIYKENKLLPKDGFYIYYRAKKNRKADIAIKELRYEEIIDLNKEVNDVENMAHVEITSPDSVISARGKYRQMLSEQKQSMEKESGNGGLAIAIAMLVFIIAVGAYENRDSIFGTSNQISTEAGATEGTETESENTIPVEVVPGTEDE